MATTTTNFGWTVPSDTDLVKDGASAIRTALGGVDTSMVDLKGGTTGQVLSKASNTDMDFTWVEQDDTTLSFNAQTGTTYTLVASDASKLVTASNASAITITVPPSVFVAGNQINVAQLGAGQVTFSQGSGVTIVSAGATASAPKIGKQYAAATIICTSSNNFLIIGAIA
jgi:RAB protein geranylgeranyltransferase component A